MKPFVIYEGREGMASLVENTNANNLKSEVLKQLHHALVALSCMQ